MRLVPTSCLVLSGLLQEEMFFPLERNIEGLKYAIVKIQLLNNMSVL